MSLLDFRRAVTILSPVGFFKSSLYNCYHTTVTCRNNNSVPEIVRGGPALLQHAASLRDQYSPPKALQENETEKERKKQPRKRIPIKKLLSMDPFHVHKSMMMHSSYKKVAPLCRQIARQPFYDALLQMQMSSKRVSKRIAHALVEAKENAIKESDLDPSTLYVSEAWVGRGPYSKKIWPLSRGRTAIRRSPRVHVTVVLKDKRALMRFVQYRLQRKDNKPVWQPLQDKPFYNKRNQFTC
ncbi:ribosomal protein subunit L22 [Schizosaccharomyces japonicus yFS275]|uniref:Ribosomal protein subunit L22 n=1 Tax=Schizosaccharomyces japonicus (strain yFS275 / FY16936) TaxID=402676 RepID=B6K3K3_SCHJY|nr:ribosomal protein subunit L22 [Schizosaccharomyces japonicus yFS275]EEB08060.1 ribosomal protein subunit L22 [Schizosaccharomyces japonicus yFS275]